MIFVRIEVRDKLYKENKNFNGFILSISFLVLSFLLNYIACVTFTFLFGPYIQA